MTVHSNICETCVMAWECDLAHSLCLNLQVLKCWQDGCVSVSVVRGLGWPCRCPFPVWQDFDIPERRYTQASLSCGFIRMLLSWETQAARHRLSSGKGHTLVPSHEQDTICEAWRLFYISMQHLKYIYVIIFFK